VKHSERAVAYLRAIESRDFDNVRGFLHPDIRQTEWPNKIAPNGITRTLSEMEDGFAKGLKVVSKQTYEVTSIMEQDDGVALEAIWRGTLAIDVGALKAGEVMTTFSGMFLRFQDGLIVAQRNYDCFAPF
jgi:ketosteroid isomerase-like protein